uniref:Succinate dehydrogenase, hydrophobic membrane anchor protein n=1 Tax=Schistosoma mansoni TaxID=6183 RepID=A0A5K4F7Q6_SCHMA
MAISPRLIEYGLKAAGIITSALFFSMGGAYILARCIIDQLFLM